MLDNSKIKKAAVSQLKTRWLIPFIAVFASNVINFLLKTTETMMPENGNISLLFSFFKLLCSILLSFAITKISLDMTKSNEPLSFSDYTDSFTYWSPAIRAFLWMLLWIVIFVVIISVPASFIFILSCGLAILKSIDFSSFDFSNGFHYEKFDTFSNPEDFFNTLFTEYIGLAILMIVLFCVITAVIIFKCLQYSQIMYIIADNKKISVKKAMRVSIEYMKGHKGELFCLCLSFIGWIILCIVPCFFVKFLTDTLSVKTVKLIMTLLLSITFSFLGPYFNLSLANFYNEVKKDALSSGRVKTEDLQ